MFCRARRVAAVLGVALAASASAVAAQQPAPSSLVPGAPSDSSRRAVTALGIERDARSLGTAQQTVRGDSITAAGQTNIVSALAGRVAGADVSGTGASGTSVTLLLRGGRTPDTNDQPLFVVDGVPVANSVIRGLNTDDIDYGSTLGDIDPNDVASITVLSGPNAAALYGSRAQNGVVLITTKSAAGTRGFSVTARQDYTLESPMRLPAFQTRFALGSDAMYGSRVVGTWGPAVYGTNQVQWWSNGQPALLVAQPNNLRDFLVQGHTATTSAAVSAASQRGDVRLGIADVGQDGLQPNSGLSRINATLSAGMSVLPRLRIRINGQYANADAHNQPVQGVSGDDALTAFILDGAATDDAHLRTDALTTRNDAFAGGGMNNPYWDAFVHSNGNSRDHAIGVVSADYDFASWFTASIRTGIDWWHDHQFQRNPDDPSSFVSDGFSTVGATTYREQNSDLLVSIDHSVGANVGMSLDAGVATRGGRTNESIRFMDDFGRIALDVFTSRVKTNSAYGRAGFAFDSAVFLEATGRKDWLVGGPEFYPSVSAAYDFVHHGPNGLFGGVVSAGKLRASWAQVGGETGFTSLDRTTSWEEGVDLGFLRDRVTLGATYYDERTLSRGFDFPPFGVTQQPMATTDRGVELTLGATALKRANGLQWDLGLRFASNRSRVQGPASFSGIDGVGNPSFVTGRLYGTIFAYVPLRDSLGRALIDGGFPEETLAPLGSELPSWVGGLESDLRYKHFSLMVLVDTRQGGHVYSNTNLFGTMFGTLASTTAIRQHGETIADGGGVVLPGVNGDGTPNTTPISPEVYYGDEARDAMFTVYSGSAVELSEVRLGYSAAPRLAARLHLTTLEVALIGRNLLVHAAAPNFDPQSVFDAGPGQGQETFGVPSTRSLGLTLMVTP
jgi:TonB-dependent SusC/RagA subfamily outer membrane receptor